MNLEDDLLKKFRRLTSLMPVSSKLALAKNKKLYWLYYAGMGQTDYHEMPEFEQKVAHEMLSKNIFYITDKTQTLPVFDDKGFSGEIVFKIVAEKT